RSVGIVRDVADERMIDLQRVDRESLQIAQRGLAGVEVVERNADAELLQLIDRPYAGLRTLHRAAFGDFELQKPRRQAGLVDDLLHALDEVLLLELTNGKIHRQRQRAIPRIV